MAQLKDFQSGAAGDNITVVGTLAAKGTSSSGADLKLYEDTDNGTNYVGFIAPASIASNVQWTLPSADGSSGQALQTNGSGTLSFATLGISAGGTGQTTANAAFNALAPSQTSNAGRYLKTDGTNTSWDLLDISTADITGTLPVANGGTGITSFGTGVATALGINVGSSGAFVTNGGALGTPSSGTVTNLTGTASININGTVGATTPNTGSFTTLTTSSTVTINGGTANGVAYLNGSKVLTTGSALTFDGTTLTNTRNTTDGSAATLTLNNSGATASYATLNLNAGSVNYQQFADAAGNAIGAAGVMFRTTTNHPLVWGVNGSEQMRLTSTGLGIGTSSPAQKLNVVGNVLIEPSAAFGYAEIKNQTSTAGSILRFTNGSTTSYFGKENSAGNYTWSSGGTAYATVISAYGSTAPIQFGHNTPSMTLDSSGNLGLGVTPSAWSSSMRVLQVASTALYNNGFNDTFLGANFYNDTVGTNRYINSDFAAAYGQVGGAHQWFNAPSGTAGNAISFTQAMTLDASGNLGIGTSSHSQKLEVSGGAAQFNGGNIDGVLGDAILFGNTAFPTVQKNRIRSSISAGSSGTNLLVFEASTSTAGTYSTNQLVLAGTGRIGFQNDAMTLDASGNLVVGGTSANVGVWNKAITLNTASGNAAYELTVAGSAKGFFAADASNVYLQSSGAIPLIFTTNGSERARITSGGYFKASNDGTYVGATGVFHEFRQTANDATLNVSATNASFSNRVLLLRATRDTTNASYYFIGCYNDTAAAFRFYVADSGNVTNTNGSYGTISDAKMKTDIVDAGSQWADIKALRFRKFKMKDDPSGLVQLGVVAQEVELTSPGLVDEHQDRDAEGNDLGTTTKSVKTSVLLMKAAVALQEAMTRIETLEAKIADLEAK
jgi:hypothetical protein